MLVIGAVTLCPASAFAFSQSDLFDSVEEGYDIKLENDIYLSQTLVIPSGSNITLDLSSHKLDMGLKSCVENGSVIRVEKGSTLKNEDTSGYNSGLITGGIGFLAGLAVTVLSLNSARKKKEESKITE